MKPALVGTATSAIQAIIQFSVIVIIAKYLGVDSVGKFSYINAIVLLVSMAFSFGVRQAYVVEHRDYGFTTFLLIRLLGMVATFFVSLGVVYCVDKSLLLLFFPIVVYRIATMLFDFQYAHYQVKQQYIRILASQVAKYILSFVGLWVAITLGYSLHMSMWVFTLSLLLVHLIFDVLPLSRAIMHDKVTLNFFDCLRKCAPLSVNQLALNLQNNASRIFLGYFGGTTALGHFAVAFQIYNMLSIAFNTSLNFYLKKEVKVNHGQIKTLVIVCAALTIVASLGWALLGHLFLSIFFDDNYLVIYSGVLLILGFMFFRVMGVSFQWLIFKTGSYGFLAKHQIVISILTTSITGILVSTFLYEGAIYSIIVSSVIYCTYMGVLSLYVKKH